MKTIHLGMCAISLSAPLAVKTTVPSLQTLIRPSTKSAQVGAAPFQEASYLVASLQGTTLTLWQADGDFTRVRLTGLRPSESTESAGHTTPMLLQTSNGQVALIAARTLQPGLKQAVVQLPDGKSLQHILIENGLAVLDKTQLKELPQQVALDLQHTQDIAQAHQVNLWSSRLSGDN